MPKKPTFSPTRFSTYLRCPLKYHLAYNQKLSRFYGRARPGFSLGSSVHRALDAMQAQGGTDAVSEEQVLRKFQETWQSAGYGSKEEELAHFEAGHAMIREFYASEKEHQGETILTEKMLRQDRGEYILTGKIDRLDRLPDGSLEVIDYKSGRTSLEPEDVASEVGLMVYEILVRHREQAGLFPDTPVRVAIYALRINRKVSILRAPEESREVEAFIDALAHEILAEETFPGRPIEGCPGCDFRRICPVYTTRDYPVLPSASDNEERSEGESSQD